MVEDLDGTRTALIIRAMDEESGETARLNEPHAGDLSKGPAVTSLVLGILAFVIQLLAWGGLVHSATRCSLRALPCGDGS